MPIKASNNTTYVALLRGINVGGNNIIKMAALQMTFQKMGFSAVRTFIQSGNVIFKTSSSDSRKLEQQIEKALAKEYSYQAKVIVRSFDEMAQLVKGMPKSRLQPSDKKYNVLFLRSSIDSPKILDGLNPKKEIEEVLYQPGVLYWSANTGDLTRTTMVKLSSQKIYQEMTIRNLNTTRKIFELMKIENI